MVTENKGIIWKLSKIFFASKMLKDGGGLNMFEMVPGSEAESKIHRPTDLE